MKKVEVSAPGKLMLFGEHAVIYNRPCIVTAVNQRMKVRIETRPEAKLEIDAPGVGVVGYMREFSFLGKGARIPKEVRFLEIAVKNFFEKYKLKSGLKIQTKSEFSSKFGFGSSSAVTVATIKGLSELFQAKVDNHQLFNLAYKTVLGVQGVGSGFDLAAAIWGGTIYFVTGGKIITPLKVGRLSLMIGYTGIKADTPTLVQQVAKLRKSHTKLVEGVFDIIGLLVQEAKKALLKADWKRLGELMNLNQGLLDGLGVNTKKLSDLIFITRKFGAWGAKLSGAGGGDCMIALGSERKRYEIARAIEKAGGKYLEVKPNAEGVKIE